MSEVSDPRIGALLENRYTITRRLADGGMASVYLANDSRLERTVAIKIIHSQLAQGPHKEQFLHRFHAEAKAAAALSNPNIVQVYDTGEFDGLQYIVMEYVHGVNLRQAMEQTPTFSVRDTLKILSETLDGLSSAHQAGLVHRDIKPENILINSRGHVQITDFGLAKAVSNATMGTTGLLLGTAAYLAPEMIEANHATPQSDLYSVGIMGYEMLSGNVPFTSDNPITMVFKHVHDDVPALTSVSTQFPQALVDFISRLSSRDASRRPADASSALAELRSVGGVLENDQLFYRFLPASPTATRSLKETAGDQTATIDPLPNHQDSPTQQLLHANSAPVVERTSILDAVPSPPDTDPAEDTEFHNGGDSPSATDTSAAVPSKSSKKKNTKKKKSSPAKRRRRVIGTILAVLVVLIAAAVTWWWFWGPGSYWVVPQASDKPCSAQNTCTLEGASYDEYKKTLAALGIDYSSTQAYSDTINAGDIISSTPAVNQHVTKRGGKLKVVVSQGVKKVQIPADLLDCSQIPDAKKSLLALGMKTTSEGGSLKVAEEYSLDADLGCAISSSITPGTTINHNDSLTLTVSKGPKPVTIPQLAGVSQDEATTALEALKLSVKTEESFSDSIAAGSIISSQPASDQEAHWGDEVTLSVSKGPEMVEMPSLVGTSKDSAVKKLEALGFTVKTQTSAIGETLHLVLKQSVDGGKQTRLRDTSGNPTVITLTVV